MKNTYLYKNSKQLSQSMKNSIHGLYPLWVRTSNITRIPKLYYRILSVEIAQCSALAVPSEHSKGTVVRRRVYSMYTFFTHVDYIPLKWINRWNIQDSKHLSRPPVKAKHTAQWAQGLAYDRVQNVSFPGSDILVHIVHEVTLTVSIVLHITRIPSGSELWVVIYVYLAYQSISGHQREVGLL